MLVTGGLLWVHSGVCLTQVLAFGYEVSRRPVSIRHRFFY